MALRLNNIQLQQVKETKFLGIIIDQNLNWSKHINHVISKVRNTVRIFYHLRYLFPLKTLRILYHSFVHSHILFGLTIYGSTYTTNLNSLQIAQNSILRIMFFTKNHDSIAFAYSLLDILTVRQELKFRLSVLTYKLLKGTIILPHIKLCLQVPRRDTRSSSQGYLNIPHIRTNYGLFSFAYQSSMLWNTIDQSIRLSPSLPLFKSRYRLHLTITSH